MKDKVKEKDQAKENEKLVAILSPWDKIHALAKRQFRIESLPAEKRVMVWRDDLQSETSFAEELSRAGVAAVEFRQQPITNWKVVERRRIRIKDDQPVSSFILHPPPSPHSHSIVAGGFELMS